MAPTRRSACSTRAVVDGKQFDLEDFNDDAMDIAVSNNDGYTIAENKQSKASIRSCHLFTI